MTERFVSLIHGTRRLHRRSPNRAWMRRFGEYLLGHGTSHVSSFDWSGGLLKGLRAADAEAYGVDLLQSYRRAHAAGGSLSIVAKSLGGVIAERALVLLNDEIQVDLFLRIGVPDARTELRLPNVRRVVDVTSRNDFIDRIGRWLTPLFWRADPFSKGTTPEKIRFLRLTHFALTECTSLHAEGGADATTYDLYRRLLTSGTNVK